MAATATAAAFEGAVKNESGMMFRGVQCDPVVDKCEGCDRVREFEGDKFCTSYPHPAAKWARGACNFATHVRAEVGKGGQIKVNPLKASKRAARGR